ncbi:MAG: ATP-binding cassette domain-containing protein [Thermomicrobiales bacterium]|nr:ATP-binding cassette domain-containing protein [Thermomicrobiales bacterium]
MSTIVAESLTYQFPRTTRTAIRDISWQAQAGTLTLVVGDSGAGKSTLLRCLNGLIPHFHGGHIAGHVHVLGHDTRDVAPRDLAHAVGLVFQDPEAQIIADRVEDEIVFGMENLGMERRTMRVRLEETLDLLGIHHLRDRETATLSGGERQRVAIAAAIATRPDLLVLDEPTSQLDPLAAHDVLAAIRRLNDDLGMTVVLAEHRLDRVLAFAERIALLRDGQLTEGTTQEMLEHLDDVPPLVELARALGWQPIPLTVREARRHIDLHAEYPALPIRTRSLGDELVRLEGVRHRYEGLEALRDVALSGYAGEVIAIIGRNGSGKTTLLKHVNGLLRPSAGRVIVNGADAARRPVHELARVAGYVPQNPSAILHQETLADELRFTLRAQQQECDGAIDPLLETLGIQQHRERHPLDLSGGERQRAALAAIAVAQPSILLLDEPTRGLPGHDKATLAGFVRQYADAGRLVIVATHDVEFVANAADRVIVLADGEIIADGPPRQTLAGSLTFGTQMNRLFGGEVLTVADALATIGHQASND